MNLAGWFRRVFAGTHHSARPNPARRHRQTRLQVEQLEDRCVPALVTLASFDGIHGAKPTGALVQDSQGNLFGNSYSLGVVYGLGEYPGTVFEVAAGSGAITTLATYDILENPRGGLVEDSDGNLFGISVGNGVSSHDSVIEVKAGSGAITTLATFPDIFPAEPPNGGLIEDSNGNLFGTTYNSVFELMAGSGTITTLASLGSPSVVGGLVEDSSGNLFGATQNPGSVFEVKAGSGTITTLASFRGMFGPNGGLVLDSGGNLFGTTIDGGAYGTGSVFEVKAGSSTVTTLASFTGDGPTGGLVEDSSGNLFGTTSNTVFEVKAGSGVATPLASFNSLVGYSPNPGLVLDGNGNLFGTTQNGGANNYGIGPYQAQGDGTVFEVTPGGTPPSVMVQPTDQTVNAGQRATFTVSASGTPSPTVQWQVSSDGGFSFSPIPGATATTLTVTAQPDQDGNQYRALFSNPSGQAQTKAATLTVHVVPAIPVVTLQPIPQTVIAGNLATFTVAASGYPTPSVQWQVRSSGSTTFSAIAGATSTTYSFTAQSGQNGNQYRAVFTNTVGTATTAAVGLTVYFQPAITASPTNQTVVAAHVATFTARANGNPSPTVQWQLSTDGGTTWAPIKGATKTTLSVPNVTIAQDGSQYRAVFSNSVGQNATAAATLTVTLAPAIIHQPPTAVKVIAGNQVTIAAAASGYPAPTVQWQFSTDRGRTYTPLDGATSATLTFTAQASDNGKLYQAVFTNPTGMIKTTALTLTVNVPPAVTADPTDQTVTAGQTAIFLVTASGRPTPMVQWQVSSDDGSNWTTLKGATSTTLTLNRVTHALNGNKYRALFTNVAGQVFSSAATLTVN